MMMQVCFLPRLARLLLAALGAIVLTGCGGGADGFSIGGSLSGLAAGQQVTLLDNGGDALTLSADGTFEFSSKVAANASYLVSVGTQPTGQTCTVSSASGAGVTANVSSVSVVCSTNTFTIGGALSGLAAGQQVTLLDNGGDALTLTANGSFSFATLVAYGGSYAVTIGTQPTGKTCSVSSGSGSGVSANVASVSVTCTSYTVGGTLSGLAAGQQFTLLDNASDSLVVTANGTASFASTVAQGASYVLTFQAQPASQTCSVSENSGVGTQATATVTKIVCSSSSATIGGTLSGLAAGEQLTLLNNSGDPLLLSANGSFVFPTNVALGASYTVVVGTQPSGQVCSVSNGAGYPVGANVSSVSVTCESAMHAYVVNKTDATVSQYSIGSGGALSSMSPSSIAASSPAAGLVLDPTNRYLYMTINPSSVYEFSIGGGGVLSSLSPASINPGTPQWDIAAEPTGHYVYVSVVNSLTLEQGSIGASGQLTFNGSCPVGGGPEGVAVDPTGRYVYVANSTANSISQLAIVPGGTLTSVASATTSGSKPTYVAVDPTGRYVFVANNYGSSVSQFSIGPGGVLSPLTIATVAAGGSPSGIAIH